MAGFFPGKNYGGPPVSVDNFCSLMKNDDCYIITCNHDKDEITAYENIPTNQWVKRNNCQVKYLPDKDYTKRSFEKVILELRPDVLYLQGLFQGCILHCLYLSKKYGLKVVLAPRGELCAGAFKKKYKKLPYIMFLKLKGLLNNIYYQSTSEEETEAICKYLGVNPKKVFFLANIPSIPDREYEKKMKEKGISKFVFLSRIHPKKNLISAIRYFQNINGKVSFDIYGPIEDKTYWENCQQEIKKLPNNIIVNYCGLVAHDEVHQVFSKYDAFLFPTFSENYGHVIAEALSVGTPVIISDQTPWQKLELVNAGWDIPLDEEKKYISSIQFIVDIDDPAYRNMCKNSKQFFMEQVRLKELESKYKECFFHIFDREIY